MDVKGESTDVRQGSWEACAPSIVSIHYGHIMKHDNNDLKMGSA